MDTFRTPINPLNHRGLIRHGLPGIMLGSCFTDNIGQQLTHDLFDVMLNPFGTLYNPASIAECLDRISGGNQFTYNELIEYEGRWHSLYHHSSFSFDSPEATLDAVNTALADARAWLQDVKWSVITLGSAWVYVRKGRIVANCHKLPSSEFSRIMLSVDDAEACINHIIELLPVDAPLILTVSPIRHKGDGPHGNQLSKSTLLLAIDRVCQHYPARVIYFPSYEIMMDDLRDYRFYDADMIHPSSVAIDYIYSIFKDSFFNPSTITLTNECRKLYQRLSHRPLAGIKTRQAMLGRMAAIDMARKMASDYPELQRPISRLISQ